MQIVETANEGLKRAYSIRIAAGDIAALVDGEVKKIAPQVQMQGFRKGKVPANLVRKLHGPQIHQEALNTSIRDAMDKLVAEHRLRPAMQPAVSLGEGYEQGKDAELEVALEVLPVIETPSLDGLKLEKLVVPVADSEVDEQLQRIASQSKQFVDAEDGHVAATGDQVVCDFIGKLDGVNFDGGSAENQPIELGAGRLIPGFEEQLVGVKSGDERQITVTFPADYPAENLASKNATFDITVHAVKVAGENVLDDDFAKNLGLQSMEQLRGLLRGQLEQETAGQTRTQMKRALLDQLAAAHDFDVPPSMVEAEFEQIWQQLAQEAGQEADPAAALAEIEAEKDDYHAIAIRRVRLGLLLSEIGQTNGVEVSQQEMSMLVTQAAQQYRPEERQRFTEYVQSDPMVAAQLRAPLYEDKVVDFLFDKAEVTTREVTREELQAAIEADDGKTGGTAAGGHVHGPDCDHGNDHAEAAPAKRKAAPKKAKPAAADPEAAAPAETAVEEKPAKKPVARKAALKDDTATAAEPAAEAKPKKKAAAKKD